MVDGIETRRAVTTVLGIEISLNAATLVHCLLSIWILGSSDWSPDRGYLENKGRADNRQVLHLRSDSMLNTYQVVFCRFAVSNEAVIVFSALVLRGNRLSMQLCLPGARFTDF